MMLFKGYPQVRVSPPLGENGPGAYGVRQGMFGLGKRIVLDWRTKNDWEEFCGMRDVELTVNILKEETLHYVLHKTINIKTCRAFDNLEFDLRMLLQQ